ncbi:MAG: hypothetical protein HRU09_11890 [Oligoflexales bacterium]|nr:hypothetical protein [Oligoflexales bacterium]
MKKKRSKIHLAAIVTFGLISSTSFLLLLNKGAFEAASSKTLNCHSAFEVKGTEDLLVLSGGRALISSQDRIAKLAQKQTENGKLLLLDLEKEVWIDLTIGFNRELQPLSMSAFTSPHKTTLFVINQTQDGYQIERFALNGDHLEHEHTYKTSLLVYPAGIAAINHEEFFLMNAYGLYTESGRLLESILPIRLSHILYISESAVKKLPFRFKKGHGIAYEPNTKVLYAADMSDKKIFAFHALETKNQAFREWSLDTHPAQINLDRKAGGIWVTAYPNLYQQSSHNRDPINIAAPSQILYVGAENNRSKNSIEAVHFGNFPSFSGASTVGRWKDKLYLGAPFAKHIMRCYYEISPRYSNVMSKDLKPRGENIVFSKQKQKRPETIYKEKEIKIL